MIPYALKGGDGEVCVSITALFYQGTRQPIKT